MHTTSSSGVCAGALAALIIATMAGACTSRPDRPTVNAASGGSTTGTAGSTGNPTSATGGNGTGGNGTSGNASAGTGIGGMTVVGVDDATCTAFTPTRFAKLTPEDPIVATKMAALNQSQMIELMHGGTENPIPWDESSFTGNGVQAAGIKDFIMRDGPRGVRAVVGEYKATSFAVAEARAASSSATSA